jgi:hypothetical protein
MLKKCQIGSLDGDYLVVNSSHNLVVRLDSVDLESLGRGAKVLVDWEVLDETYAERFSSGL